MKEQQKMEQGQWYDANFDPELLALRLTAEELCFALNQTAPSATAEREALLQKLLGELGENCTILAPFIADYGCYSRIGHDTFINHNAYLMDGGGITIGHHCFIGPNCGMYTAIHPLLAPEREQGLEKALPIVIGDHCWIGADVTILPGVTIGDYAVIGAGSVVTEDIPPHTLALGNPCRVVRKITEQDSIELQ